MADVGPERTAGERTGDKAMIGAGSRARGRAAAHRARPLRRRPRPARRSRTRPSCAAPRRTRCIRASTRARPPRPPGVLGVFTGADLPEIRSPWRRAPRAPAAAQVPRAADARTRRCATSASRWPSWSPSRRYQRRGRLRAHRGRLRGAAARSLDRGAAHGAPARRSHDGSTTTSRHTSSRRAGDPDAALADGAARAVARAFRSCAAAGTRWRAAAVAARYDRATGAAHRSGTPPRPRTTIAPAASRIYDMPEDEDPRDRAARRRRRVRAQGAQFYGEEVVVAWLGRSAGPAGQVDRGPPGELRRRARRSARRTHRGRGRPSTTTAGCWSSRTCSSTTRAPTRRPAACRSSRRTHRAGPYSIPNIAHRVCALLHEHGADLVGARRGPPAGVFVMERMMDRIAEHLGLDPADVRARNLIQADEFPYKVGIMFRDGSPLTYDSGDYPGAAARRPGADRLRGGQRRAAGQAARARAGTSASGWPVYVEGCGLGPYEGAKVRLDQQGPRSSSRSPPPGRARATRRSTRRSPPTRSGWTWTTSTSRPATPARSRSAQGTFASPRSPPPPGRPCSTPRRADAREAARDGGRRCWGRRPATWTSARRPGRRAAATRRVDAAAQARADRQHRQARASRCRAGIRARAGDLHATSRRERAAYASGAHAALVEVDPETGEVEIVEYVIGHDCGNVINPLLVEGQVLGGFAHGHRQRDVRGAASTTPRGSRWPPATSTTRCRRRARCRPSSCSTIQTPSPLNPLGVKGAGEGGTIPVPAAIANAVEDALRPFGARIATARSRPAGSAT